MKEMNAHLFIPVLVGTGAGYLANYLADVLPNTRRLTQAICAHCGNAFPIMDYLLLRKCVQCNARRGVRAWITPAALTALNLYAWLRPTERYAYFVSAIMLAYFAVVFIIDMEHRLILHPTSVVGAALALGAGFLANKTSGATTLGALLLTLLGGLSGFVIMLAFYFLGVAFSRIRARKLQAAGQETDDEEALGAGDVILSGILGMTLGFPLAVYGVFLGILLAGVVGTALILGLLVTRQYKQKALMVFMPYGPFLLLGAFLWMFVLSAA